jgi:hypothetical protein
MAKVLQLVNRPESTLALLKIDGQAIPVSLLDGPAGAPVVPAVLQGNIFIDPANSTGNASDANPGTATAPFLTYAGVVKVWGSTRPLISVNTALVFLSDSPALGADPIIWEPWVTGGALVQIKGQRVPSHAIALAGVTAKNRTLGSNAALSATYDGTVQAAQLIVNGTHPSRAWAQGGTGFVPPAFQTTQPLVATTPGGTSTPAEVNTWANLDAVTTGALTNVNLARFAPVNLDGESAGGAFLYNLNLAPVNSSFHCVLDGTNGVIRLVECSATAEVTWIGLRGFHTATNCFFEGGIETLGTATFSFVGGAIFGGTFAASNHRFDADIILALQCVFPAASNVALGLVYNDNAGAEVFPGAYLQAGAQATIAPISYGSATLYGNPAGPGEWHVQGNARLVKSGSTWVAQVTNPTMVTGIELNGARTGLSHTNAAPAVWNGGIATTPANLDAAAGVAGFGGNALSAQAGGASTSNSV